MKAIGYSLLAFASIMLFGPMIYFTGWLGVGIIAFAVFMTSVIYVGAKLVTED